MHTGCSGRHYYRGSRSALGGARPISSFPASTSLQMPYIVSRSNKLPNASGYLRETLRSQASQALPDQGEVATVADALASRRGLVSDRVGASNYKHRMDVAMRAAHTGMEDIRTFTKSRKTQKFGGEKRQDRRSSVKKASQPVLVDLNDVDFLSAPPKALQDMYSSLCAEGRLDDALFVIKQSIRAGRDDALKMFKHYEFLRCAARKKSVHYGMRFVQLFPRKHVDARTYNMLVSVCAEAGDVKAALRCADMLKASGLKLDTILYTNLIKVCAAASNADRAFEIFKEMTAAGIKVEKHVFATMLNACAAQIVTLNHEADRRNQLVLLERAFELVDSMSDLNVRPDAAVWNALITVAGKAEKLQRAFDVLDEMISKGEKPNARTYVALIDTCARTGDQDLALRIYKRAMMEGHTNELKIYSAAINACVKSKSGADVQGAMDIFADLQRAGVNGDSALYGALIMAAGRSGSLELAMDLNDEMLRDGLEPCPGTESALITIFVQNGELEKAEEIYHRMNKSGIVPHMHAFNALINSEAKAMRLGSVTTLVRDMISCGLQPDAFTFTAVLNACQHSKQSELALDVYRVMRMRGIRVDEVHALLLLKICYSELRKIWDAAASDTARNTYSTAGISRSKEKLELLSVLSPLGKQYTPKDNASDIPWQSHACQIYRDALTAGVKPSLPLLNMAMMCLKVPLYIARGFGPSTEDLAAQTLQLHAGWQPRAGTYEPEVQRKIGLESIYHVQALSFMEDAIVGGHLPAFTVDGTEPHDLTQYPPAVAEVYALLLLQASQRQVVDGRRYLKNNIKFLVPSYDRKKVFLPSFEESEDSRFRQELADRYEKIVADSPNLPPELRMLFPNDMDRSKPRQPKQTSSEATGLGVAAVLRRLRIGAKESGSAGTIVVEARDAARWAKRIQKEIERRSASALALQKPYGQQISSSSLLQKSQSSIRMSGSS